MPPHLFHVHKLVFLGELVDPGAEPRAQHETIGAAFYSLEHLPELSMGRTVPFHIEAARRALADPDIPTYFD
jgi:hypothetical protein